MSHLYLDLLPVVRLRREAREQRALQQRVDGRAAFLQIPERTGPDETRIGRDTAVLYARLVSLEDAGKLRWDEHRRRAPKNERIRYEHWLGDWVKRTVVMVRTDHDKPPVYTEDELLSRFDKVRHTSTGWTARCTAHEDRSPSLSIKVGHTGWLVKCWAGCDFADIVGVAGLEPQRMFFK